MSEERKISNEPLDPMPDLDQQVFEFYEQRVSPGTLAYCECDAGPRHLTGLVPDTKEIYLHFHVNPAYWAVTILRIFGKS